jgi:predicted DNA-binding transcriptional regulator YafY
VRPGLGGAQEDLGLGTAARSAILKVMRAVPEPFRPAATVTSQRILVHPAGWMRSPDPAGALGVLQAAVKAARTLLSFGANVEVTSPPEVRADLAAVATEITDLYSNVRLG